MIYRQVSSKRVVAKILTDLNIQEENIRISDFISWIGEGVEKIGSFPQYNVKITGKEDLPLLKLADYQARIPSDLINILGIKYSSSQSGPFIPLRYGTGTYGARLEDTTSSTTTNTSPNTDIIYWAMNLYGYTYEEALEEINADSSLKDMLNTLITLDYNNLNNKSSDETYAMDYVYYVNNNYIKLNTRTGYLMLAYQAMPQDEEGFPMVPEDQSFIEALYWYVTVKLLYPDWIQGRIRTDVYYDARRNWNFYCNQAYAKAMTPSADKMESLKNKWLEFYPEIGDFSTDFSTTGNRQIIF